VEYEFILLLAIANMLQMIKAAFMKIEIIAIIIP
jgi:hypothetical protein